MRRNLRALARVSVAVAALSLLTLQGVARGQAGVLAPWGTTAAGTLVLEQAATCEPSWLPAFGTRGVDGTINALTVFDDGSGPALYAGGSFATAGGVAANLIAKWNGTTWSALGSGVSASVSALAVFDDGSGPALYAGGSFGSAGGVAATRRIAKWNGLTWSALVTGVSGSPSPAVNSLAVFDDGSGPALYVGGSFTSAGGVAATNVARWNGTNWSALGTGTDDAVLSLAAFDDGSGPALCAGGEFTTAGGVGMNFIGKWDGASWSALGSGMSEGGAQGTSVKALAVFDDGGGPALYAGGGYTKADGVLALHIAKWNGSNWSPLGFGLNKQVWSLTVFDDGSGPALYAGGSFTGTGGLPVNSIARWDGTLWSALGGGTDVGVNALTVFDDGSGPALFAGGGFTMSPAGDTHLAKWGGCSLPPTPWTDLGSGLAGASGIPQLTGAGDLLPGTPGALALVDAAPSAVAALFISTSNTPTPFKGGTLLTVPVLLMLPLSTNALGEIHLPWSAWPSGLSGVSLFFQFGIQDVAAVNGVALSNALGADVP